MNAAIQKHVANQYQSTALSIASFAQYIMYGIGSLAFGVLLQILGITMTRVVLITTALIAVVIVLLYGATHRKVAADTIAS